MDYQQAYQFEGEIIKFRTDKGNWRIGRVVKVTKDKIQIHELTADTHKSDSYGGYGWGWGPWHHHHHFRHHHFRHHHHFRPFGNVAVFNISAIQVAAFPFFFW